MTQSTLQDFKLQAVDSSKAGQADPPPLGAVIIVLFLVCTPAPQVVEHEDQTPQSDTTQLTEQGTSELHFLDCSRGKSQLPPFSASATTPLVLLDVPPIQELEQAVHEAHSESSQSTGTSTLCG